MDTIDERSDRAQSVVRRDFGVELVALEPVIGGLDHGAQVWFATDDAGAPWSVKASRRDGRFGLALASALGDAQRNGVAAPHRARDGRPWTEDSGLLVSLAPWIVGEDAVDAGEDALPWEEFGAVLRGVHDSAPPADAVPPRRGIRRAQRPPAELLAEIDQHLDPELRDRLHALARAERRLKRARTPAARVPVHGDPHPGNVVIDEHGSPWLIDFDEATVAPREVDLLLIELGVIFARPITDAQRRAFRAGYGETLIDDERIARFGCVRAVEDVTSTVLRSLDPAQEEEQRELLAGQIGPHGLVSLVETALDRLGQPAA
ncbi:aminoglycoside phosphotransferase family protein [Rathayibacter sp. VKM Ac-2856]|uniref:phosphotransferase enzyme family protein n=1 Tax=unclassified Rathayibacter TaxID=2609250 RepID=UPI001565351B|nr:MULTISPECIES: aminoglycoside phosphotransferase family protein [unclassified Rathayibacter]NQX05077.1 aminoglycoside phosphotransferase family protein [Rathayibacter sp. VKM Ac-2858]NQX20245.1 aminoglycoside phosphotransferase family protein [Rathayibacter sp. VKM Ac-2856]